MCIYKCSLSTCFKVCCSRRSSGKDITDLHDYCTALVAQINAKYSAVGYAPVVWLERPVRGPSSRNHLCASSFEIGLERGEHANCLMSARAGPVSFLCA